jgi:hypothetical protein
MSAQPTTPLVSASQVILYEECPRKWAWKYVAKIDVVQSDAGALGDDIDGGQLQPYLTEGRSFDFTRESGYIAASGLAHLPPPKSPGLEVQKHFMIPSASSVPGKPAPFGFQGFMDLWLPDGRYMPNLPPAPSGVVIPAVGDFKSTKDVNARWIKTPKTLGTDVQAMTYATSAMYSTGARIVDLVWIYFQTKDTRKSKRVHLRVHADQVLEQFMRIDGIAVKMFDHRRASEVPGTDCNAFPLKLEPNTDMCTEYGGCPYQHKCNLSPSDIVDAQAAKHAKNLAAKAAAYPKEEKNMSQPQTNSLFARLAAQKAAVTGAPPSPATSPAPEAPTVGPESLPAWATAAVDPMKAAGINPPEKDLPPAPPVSAAKTVAEPTPTEAPKAKRGRSKKEEAPPAVETAPQVTSTRPIGTLYLDCIPLTDTTRVAYAEQIFSLVQQEIQKSHNVPDYRLIDFKGAGVFASKLGELIDQRLFGDVVLDTRTPEGAIAKGVLVFRADRVVQGVR